MTALENVTRDEFNHLEGSRHEMFMELTRVFIDRRIYGFTRSLDLYDLRYNPVTKRVSLYKAIKGKAADQKTNDLTWIRSPDKPEQEILTVASRYIELYRATRQHKLAKKHGR